MTKIHLSKITHTHLANCRDALAVYRADPQISDAAARRKIETIILQHYFYAPREADTFLDALFNNAFIASFDERQIAPSHKTIAAATDIETLDVDDSDD